MDGLEGYVDRIEDGWVLGWVWVSARPCERIAIEVRVDGVPVRRCLAASYRPDLERAGKGDGRHAFEIALSEQLRDGKTHALCVVQADTGLQLVGSPLTFTWGQAPPSAGNRAAGEGFHSRFGGLWTDLPSAGERIDEKYSVGELSEDEVCLLRAWVEQGFVILPRAVSEQVIDELDAEVEAIWNGTSSVRAFVECVDDGGRSFQPAGPRFRDSPVRLLDLFAHFESARRIAFAPKVQRFLGLVFERPIVAFQSLYFRWGSRQDIHQDTAFVRVSSPLELAASWVALEDVRPNSGELEYYVGSHRLEDYLFEGTHKWMPYRSTEYEAFIASLHARSAARGLEHRRFLPKKGDALIWSADLAHGGSKNVTKGVTRKSLVTHYCPSDCEPVYTSPGVEHPRHRYDEASYYMVEPRE